MRTTAEETLRNDELIIAAAIKVFSEKGYEATAMQDIANEAQISRGPLYYRYKTKKELFLTALDAYTNNELSEFMHILGNEQPFFLKIQEFLCYATRYLRNEAQEFPRDIYADPGMEDVNEKIREAYSKVCRMMEGAVTCAINKGELKADTDVAHFVNFLFIASDGLRYSRLKSGIIPSAKKVEETVTKICEMIIAAYAAE